MKLLYKYLIYCSLTTILAGCANIVPPDGGPRDKDAPKLINLYPSKNEINVKPKQIELEFNELIDVDNIITNLSSNPIIEGEIYPIVRGKKLVLTFEKKWKDSTTYSIVLNNAVKDITEGNKVNSILISFSTGAVIDTNKLIGTITNFKSKTAIKDFTIGLYPNTDSTSIYSKKPLYITKTNETGNYTFYNLKKGIYNMYIYSDNNKDQLYDSITDIIYMKKNINIVETKTLIDIPITVERKSKNGVMLVRYGNQSVEIKYKKGIKYLNTDLKDIKFKYIDNSKIVKLYSNIESKDTSEIEISVTDSLHITHKEKIKLFFKKTKEKTDKLEYNIYPADRLLNSNDSIIVVFNKPIINSIEENNYKWNKNNDTLIISTQLIKDTFLFKDVRKWISIEMDSISLKDQLFKRKFQENYGTMEGDIETIDQNFILEIVDELGKVVHRQTNNKHFKCTWMKAGKYKLQYIVDSNGNGVWDPYDFESKNEAEEIIYYKEPINLRENWDILNIMFKTR